MKKFFYIILLSLLSSRAAAQTNADSLRMAFNAEKNELAREKIYYQLASVYFNEDPSIVLKYADTLEKMYLQNKHEETAAFVTELRGRAEFELGNYVKALPLFRNLILLQKKIANEKETAKAQQLLGSSFNALGKNDSSIFYYMQAMTLYEKNDNKAELSALYADIANTYSDEKAFDKAIEMNVKSLELIRQLGLQTEEIVTLNNLSVAYGQDGKYEKSLSYANEAMALAEKYQDKMAMGIVASSMGYLLNRFGKYDEAIAWCEKSIGYLNELNRPANVVYPVASLARAYINKKDFAKAITTAQQGFQLITSKQLPGPYDSYYKLFADAYEGMGNYKEAFDWHKKYVALSDSLLKAQNVQQIANAEAIYETQEKESQLIKQQLIIQQQTNLRNTTIAAAAILLIAAAALFFYFRNRQKLKQKEAELKAQAEHTEAEKLRDLDAMKSAFFANISHEFRTPLTLMLGPLKQMEQGRLNESDTKKYTKMMRHNGERLLHLINQMLDLSKLESGKLHLQIAKTDITGLLKATVYSFNSMAEQKQVNYHTHFPEHEIIGWIDKDKFQKIITNLLSNAFKFTPENGTVSVDVENGNQRIRITVQDTGPGIPKEQLDKIFERFYQLEGTEGGTGIGLSLVKELVQLHKGQISVNSDIGRGASFRLSIPVSREFYTDGDMEINGREIQQPITKEIFADASANEITDSINDTSLPTVLIVEDNTDLQQFISDTLTTSFNTAIAGNGKEGLEKALQLIPDLIVSDVMMPVMDGVAMTNELKHNEKTSHIPVIMLTAKAASASKIEGLKTGADDYLVKPFDGDELIVRIQNLIEQRRKLRELYSRQIISITPDKVEANSQENIFLEKVRASIDENLDNEMFGVVDLANAVNMSRSQLNRKLQALTGNGPNELIRNFRLERALELLEKGAGNVTEVAYMTGFSSPAYFSKCFSDRFGYAPGEVKKV